MIYLASPYAHSDPAVMQKRYETMVQFVNDEYRKENVVYSPIVHNHPVAVLGGLPRTWDFWRKIDLPVLRRCNELWVVCLDGWRESKGVSAEIEYAKLIELPTRYIRVFQDGHIHGPEPLP